ncbi:probable transmembrane reductase CYB561D1 isoform X2 [Betta splendens]|uniref:ascorbate ferrireductase (transmembrane) n=1 Tax=Betta splendens TaxID=158456 RepID=A0A6P7MIW6_BETSP|nr:probable transmembrane reductase CYB561D1 isoform X2 [Betta splendens]
MRSDVPYSPVGEGLGMREFWLYVWLRRAAVVAAHVTGLGLTLTVSLLSRPGTMEGALFCFRSRNGKIRLHWFCQALALIAAATGLGFMVASKNVSQRSHLVSWHSLLGVCTLAATVLQAACGMCVLFPKLLRPSSPPRLKLYHATCGLVVYLLATATVMLAMFSDWFQATVRGVAWWAFLLLPLFPALVVMTQITNAYLPRKKITT